MIVMFVVVPTLKFLWDATMFLVRGLRNAVSVISGRKCVETKEPARVDQRVAEGRSSPPRRKNNCAATRLIDHAEYQLYLLRAIITASTSAMRKVDTDNVFLFPVTNEIAPGYSEVINQPMCILTMEEKADAAKYRNLKEFEDDVRLMFDNCIKYNNTGKSGRWYRNEAKRQEKIWEESIIRQAHDLFGTAMCISE